MSTLKNIQVKEINVAEQRLVLEFEETNDKNSPSAIKVQNLLEDKLGLATVIRGTGDSVSAVTEIHGSNAHPSLMGVVRYVQGEHRRCLLDGVIDYVEPKKHYQLGICEFGDLSEPNYSSVGQTIYSFGEFFADSTQLVVKKSSSNCDLASYIGRALAVFKDGEIVGAGVVARSSSVMDNSKKICACSGKTLWEERKDHKT